MKKICLHIVLLISCYTFSQPVSIDTNTYTPTQLVNQILINSPCVSAVPNSVVAKSGDFYGSTKGIAYFTNTNPNFPITRGVVLTTGDANKVPSPNNSILSDGNNAWLGDTDLESVLLSQSGITVKSINASYLQFDFVPKTANFNFSFLFASEEYGTSQCAYSDAFAFLIKDVTAGTGYTNIAFVPSPAAPNTPISVATIRNNIYNNNCSSVNPSFFGAYNGAGFGPAINFNGQTIKMVATTAALNPAHTYRIKIVIADGNNDTGYDSAIFLEGDSFNIGQNVLGPDYSSFCPGDPLPILSAFGLAPGTTFSWSQNNVVLPGQTGSTLNLNTLNPPLVAGNNYTFSVTYNEPGCVPIKDDILVPIYPKLGALATVPNIYACNSGAANYTFDLTKNTPIIIAGPSVLPAGTLITYHLSQLEAISNSNPLTSYTITTAQSGLTIWVRINSTTTPCYEIRSFQLLIVPPPVIANQPSDISTCAVNTTDNPIRANFNLTPAKLEVLGAQSSIYNIVTFHSTLAGANANNNTTALLPLMGMNMLMTPDRTVWVRVQNISNPNCFVTASFQLIVKPLPKVDTLTDVVVCNSYPLPTLTQVGAQYWSGMNGTGVQYFANNTINTTKTIYIFNSSPNGCTNQSQFKVTIADLNLIIPLSSQFCAQYKMPTLAYGRIFKLSGGPSTPGNTEYYSMQIINTPGINTFYVWYEDTSVTPSCVKEKSFTITIIPFIDLPDYKPVFVCNTYTLPIDPNGGTYYSGPNQGLPILPSGTVISNNQKIYVYKETGTLPKNCFSEKSFDVTVGVNNLTLPSNVTSCSTYLLPVLTVGEYHTQPAGGGTILPPNSPINSTTTLWYYVPGESCTDNLSFTITINIAPLPPMPDIGPLCDVYYLPAVAHSGNYFTGPLGTGNLLPVNFAITSNQTVYFYDKLPNSTCYVQNTFGVKINKSALVDPRPIQVLKCNQCLSLDDLTNGEYYQFSGGPRANNPILPPGYQICTPGTTSLYVFNAAVRPNTCDSEYKIDVTLVNTIVNPISDVFACDNYCLPPIVGSGDYYTAPGGPKGNGTKITLPYCISTLGVTTLYVYAEDNNRVACSDEKSFKVTILQTPVVQSLNPVTSCDQYILPNYPEPGTRYFTLPGGTTTITSGNVELFPGNPIPSPIIGVNTIYVYKEVVGGTKTCYDEKPLVITISKTPTIVPSEVVPISKCDSYLLPSLTVGNYFYDTLHQNPINDLNITNTTNVYVYAASNTNASCSTSANFLVTIIHTPVIVASEVVNINKCTSYSLPALTVGNYFLSPNGVNPISLPYTVISNQSVYVYAETATTPNCISEKSFSINLFKVEQRNDVIQCDNYILPPVNVGKYYSATGGVGPLNPGQAVGTQKVYIYGTAPFVPSCSDETFFTVTVLNKPIINNVPIAQRTICDTDGINDGFAPFDLSNLNATILGSQLPPQYSVDYYATLNDANTSSPKINTPTRLQIVYVRVNNDVNSSCFSILPLQINVNKLPETIAKSGAICVDNTTSVQSPYTINSGLNSLTHNIVWTNSSGTIVGNNSNYVANTIGDYTVTATNNLTGCQSVPKTVSVFLSQRAIISYTLNEAFADSQNITVQTTGNGLYEYQLDNNNFQDSPFFDNVNYGYHVITVKDKYDCGNSSIEVVLVNYPKYFTPNGDGYHETWNVVGLEKQLEAKVYIYDRYGKLLKQLSTNSSGWDGKYKGELVPADDYWFTVDFIDKNVSRTFKSHFSLIR